MRLIAHVFMLLSCLLLLHSTAAKVIQTVVISRHCDRTPVTSKLVPKDPINWKKQLGLSPGQLTGLGITQCSIMGQGLRERYLLKDSESYIDGITDYFDSDLFKFFATSVDRTIISLNSAAFGLFPNHTGLMNDITHKESLVDGVTVIPIHTVPTSDDILLRGYDKCPTITRNQNNFIASVDYNQVTLKYSDLMTNIENWSGIPKTTLQNFYMTYDLLNAQKSHNLLTLQDVIDNWKEIEDLGFLTQYIFFDRAVQDRLGAGPLINEIMQMFQATIFGKDKTSQAKYIHYSAHDTTLQSILATLDLSSKHEELQQIPPYGSQVIFELHFDNKTSSYSVQVVIRRGYDAQFTPYALNGSGLCTTEQCAWNDFVTYIGKFSRLTMEQWCTKCGNDFTDVCVNALLKKQKSKNTVLLISVPVLIGLNLVTLAFSLILCLRMRQKSTSYSSLN